MSNPERPLLYMSRTEQGRRYSRRLVSKAQTRAARPRRTARAHTRCSEAAATTAHCIACRGFPASQQRKHRCAGLYVAYTCCKQGDAWCCVFQQQQQQQQQLGSNAGTPRWDNVCRRRCSWRSGVVQSPAASATCNGALLQEDEGAVTHGGCLSVPLVALDARARVDLRAAACEECVA